MTSLLRLALDIEALESRVLLATYEEYVDRKKSKGEKPLSKGDWQDLQGLDNSRKEKIPRKPQKQVDKERKDMVKGFPGMMTDAERDKQDAKGLGDSRK